MTLEQYAINFKYRTKYYIINILSYARNYCKNTAVYI